MRYNTVENVGGGFGGGVYCKATASIQHSIIEKNSSEGGTGRPGDPGPDGKGYGMGIYVAGNTVVNNCTIVENNPEGIKRSSGNPAISNCIIWGNGNDLIDCSATYSCIEDLDAGVGNIHTDPCFLDPISEDYHLRAVSDCIDAGDPCYSPAVWGEDIDGEPRILNGLVDMGADEFSGGPAILEISPSAFGFLTYVFGPDPNNQILQITNEGNEPMNWEITGGASWLDVLPGSGSLLKGAIDDVILGVDSSGLGVGEYNCELTVTATGALFSPQTVSVALDIVQHLGQLRVPSEFGTIQEAIDNASDGYKVIVADGTYTGAGNYNIDFGGKVITVISENGPDNCIIDCESVSGRRGFKFISGEDANSVLSGFTIKRGKISGNPARGGGIYCSGSSPKIENCVVTNNRCDGNPNAYGGGIYLTTNSDPAINGCTVYNNKVYGLDNMTIGADGGVAYGGGIYCSSDSNPVITDCTISSNKAYGGDGYFDAIAAQNSGNGGDGSGGGVYGSVLTIKDSTITGSLAQGSAGGASTSGSTSNGYSIGGGIRGDGAIIKRSEITNNIANVRVVDPAVILWIWQWWWIKWRTLNQR